MSDRKKLLLISAAIVLAPSGVAAGIWGIARLCESGHPVPAVLLGCVPISLAGVAEMWKHAGGTEQ